MLPLENKCNTPLKNRDHFIDIEKTERVLRDKSNRLRAQLAFKEYFSICFLSRNRKIKQVQLQTNKRKEVY